MTIQTFKGLTLDFRITRNAEHLMVKLLHCHREASITPRYQRRRGSPDDIYHRECVPTQTEHRVRLVRMSGRLGKANLPEDIMHYSISDHGAFSPECVLLVIDFVLGINETLICCQSSCGATGTGSTRSPGPRIDGY
jgi:hypothetical protein